MTDAAAASTSLVAAPADPLAGRFSTPGDAAIALRAMLVAGLTVGRSVLEGAPDAPALHAAAKALRQLGVRIDATTPAWSVHGLGPLGLLEPEQALSGLDPLSASLFAGLLAPYGFASLIEAPIPQEVAGALRELGADVAIEAGQTLLRGPVVPVPQTLHLAAAAEPVKSAVLLAALQIAGITTLTEPVQTADHLEKLLAGFGTDLALDVDAAGAATVQLIGLPALRPSHVRVPGDPSGAAHAIVAALTVPGSDIVVENVLINSNRTGLIDTLLEMGGDIQFLNQHETGGEPVADLRVRSSRIKGVRVSAEHAAAMLHDVPALAIAAACAQGETVIEGLGELRHGPADRLAATAAGLAANRITVTEGDQSLTVTGEGRPDGGGTVTTRGDASVAMSFLVLGLAAKRRVTIDDSSGIARHQPRFLEAMATLGARMEPAGAAP